VDLDGSLSVEEAVKRAGSDPRVEYAEPNYLVSTQNIPNDARFAEQWALLNTGTLGADIDATRAWDITTGATDVVVAIVDTGVDLQHIDLSDNKWINPGEIPGNGIDDDHNGLVDDINGWDFLNGRPDTFQDFFGDYHGTHVSGIVGAVGNNEQGIAGVAWHVKLMSVKFIGPRSGSTSDAIKSINYVIDERQRGVNVRVINASWGGPGESNSLRKAIVAAGDAGILFVCAAGNGGDDNIGDDIDQQGDFPSAWSSDISSLISVTALDRSDKLPRFANYGLTKVSVGAPGVAVLSTTPMGTYGLLDGTSMSTPHVSGIAALLWAANPSLTPAQVKDRIIRTADPVVSLASISVSSGRANAYNALTNTVPAPPSKPGLRALTTSKKWFSVDGLGFINGTSIIEVSGVALETRYDTTFTLPNGSLSQVWSKPGKAAMKSIFPLGQQVIVTVFNPTTGQRSDPFPFTRN